jgi:hypothetical protein
MRSKIDLWKKWVFDYTPHSSEKTYRSLINLIKTNTHFSFLRMGDGDIKAYLNIPMKTILSEKYRVLYEKSLDPIFKYKEETNDSSLILGIENSTVCTKNIYTEYKTNPEKLNNFYQRFKHTDALSINSIIFMHMYVYHGLNDLFEALQNRSVIIVGPNHLKNLNFPCVEKHHIVTALTHSWEHHDDYEKPLIELLKKVENPVIIYAASVTGKMLFSKMFFEYSKFSGGSPDGVSSDSVIEIKCPFNSAEHLKHLLLKDREEVKDAIPEYYWQMTANALFTNKHHAIFISYDPRFESQYQMKVLRFSIDLDDCSLLKERLLEAENELNSILKRL